MAVWLHAKITGFAVVVMLNVCNPKNVVKFVFSSINTDKKRLINLIYTNFSR